MTLMKLLSFSFLFIPLCVYGVVNDFEKENFEANEELRMLRTDVEELFLSGGDNSAYDFTLSDLTTDGTWVDLDLSGIVTKGTKQVHLSVLVKDDAAGSEILFRKNGNVNAYSVGGAVTQVANVANYGDVWVECDVDRVIEYKATNTTFTNIDITVLDWLNFRR